MVVVNGLSSCLFFTNLVAVMLKKEKIQTILCILLLTTSFLFHCSDRNNILMRIDEMVVGAAIAYVIHGALKKKVWVERNLVSTLVCIISASIGTLLFFYGYSTESFCYHPEFGNYYHALMHGFGSLSHHCILLID